MRPVPGRAVAGVVLPRGAGCNPGRAPRGSRIQVRCLGSGCPVGSVRRTSATRLVRLRKFERRLAARPRPQAVHAAEPNREYTSFLIRAGSPPKRVDRCLYPTGRSVRALPMRGAGTAALAVLAFAAAFLLASVALGGEAEENASIGTAHVRLSSVVGLPSLAKDPAVELAQARRAARRERLAARRRAAARRAAARELRAAHRRLRRRRRPSRPSRRTTARSGARASPDTLASPCTTPPPRPPHPTETFDDRDETRGARAFGPTSGLRGGRRYVVDNLGARVGTGVDLRRSCARPGAVTFVVAWARR